MVPDYCEPLIGWRAWHVMGERLYPMVMENQPWPVRAPMSATHEASLYGLGGDEPPRAPEYGGWCLRHGCESCGIYAMTSKTAAFQVALDFSCAVVVGQVALWGCVVIHERGYRAQYAYPTKFVGARAGYASERTTGLVDVQRLAEVYGVAYEEDPAWTSASANAPSSSNRSWFQSRNWFPFKGNALWWTPSPSWTSPYILRPDDHRFIIEPPSPTTLPGLPVGMCAPEIVPPTYYRHDSGLWLTPTVPDRVAVDWGEGVAFEFMEITE